MAGQVAERDSWHVLRGPDGLLHIPRPASGESFCGTDEELVDAIAPIDRAGVWCSRCFQGIREAGR